MRVSSMTYDVYGVGNALVDREYTISESILESLQVEKGMATLIDEKHLQDVITRLDKEGMLRKQAGGGSAANTIIGLQQFGGKGAYACRVADDVLGEFYSNDLKKAGVAIEPDKQAGDTGQCMVLVSEDGERTMMTYLGVSAELDVQDIDESKIKSSQYLYIEGYLAPLPNAVSAVQQAKVIAQANNTKIALTFSDPSMAKYCKQGLVDMLEGGVDVLFCNEEEACTFAEKDTLDQAITELAQYSPHLVITLGERGVLIVKDGERFEFATTAIKPIDTTGAGDVFAGAYLYGLTQKQPIAFCARLANASAARIVGKYGPRLEAYEQQEILTQVSSEASNQDKKKAIEVSELNALTEDTKTVDVDGKEIFVLNVDGVIKAYENYCPHLGIELNYMPNEFLDANKQYIVCANHGAIFDKVSGECISGPCAGDMLNEVDVEVRDKTIFVLVK